MAITRETLRLLDAMRVSIGAEVDDATRTLVAAWARAWDVLAAQWSQAIEDVIASSTDGRWPTRAQINRLDRVQHALDATGVQVSALGNLTGVTVTGALPAIAAASVDWHKALVDSQMPTAVQARGATVAVPYHRPDPQALDAIVRRTTTDVASYLQPLSADAEEAMKRRLVQGVALGDNPRTAARAMVRDVEGQFNGGLARAMNIARTEMLDAHRAASTAANKANADVVTGWVWISALDNRCCPSCLSQHGSFHKADEIGPLDHQSGRCSASPVTKSWADLGFVGVTEPPPLIQDAQATFWSWPESKQLAVMGPARLELLKSGQVSWESLAVKRVSPDWRDSMAPRSVKSLKDLAAAHA